MLGVKQTDIKFGTLALTYPFHVIEDVHHSIILGHDFIEAHNVTLDVRGKKMIIQDYVKVCTLQTNTSYARTFKPVNLPVISELTKQGKRGRNNKKQESGSVD